MLGGTGRQLVNWNYGNVASPGYSAPKLLSPCIALQRRSYGSNTHKFISKLHPNWSARFLMLCSRSHVPISAADYATSAQVHTRTISSESQGRYSKMGNHDGQGSGSEGRFPLNLERIFCFSVYLSVRCRI